MKNIYLLGAAGSIGTQTLDVISLAKHQFHIVGLSLGSDTLKNEHILNQYHVEIACLRKTEDLPYYEQKYPDVRFVTGQDGLMEIAVYQKPGLLINALSGSAGLMPTVQAIKSGKDIALANKETLVMAGDIIKELIQTYHVNLYPIDSEHSSLWQLLRGEEKDTIEKIVITASGGSLRDLTRDQLKHIQVEDALKHPNWKMGDKITIDSATMMNKGLEVIEAHYLFDLPYNRIETILHKESLVHGLIYFRDGTVKASMSVSDMRIPILYALHYPKRMHYPSRLDLVNMSFQPMDEARYPLLRLAYQVGHEGGLLPTVMNAANEAAVKLFLKKKISFLDIEKIVMKTVSDFHNKNNPTLEDIILVDQLIQQQISDRYEKR